jgi:hypothetical protein
MKAQTASRTPQKPVLKHTFRCHTDDCCPTLFVDPLAAEAKKFIIRDDWGNHINLSEDQLKTMLSTKFDDIAL